MPDVLDYKQTYERGQALADLCRSHEIDSAWLEQCGTLDQLLARVLDDCDRRLRAIPDRGAEHESALKRIRGLVSFAHKAGALRQRTDSTFALVSQVDDLERIKRQSTAVQGSEPGASVAHALELFGEISRLCHKINNPLTSLMGRTQMLQMQPDPGSAKLHKATEVIEESARRVATYVQELAQLVGQGKEELLRK